MGIPGTVSLLSMGRGRGLSREKEPDHPTLPKVDLLHKGSKPGGPDKGSPLKMESAARWFLIPTHCSTVFSVFLAFGREVGNSHRIVCIDSVT